ncbi:MAG: acetylxylan esterase [Chloroflexi bacterium]|nr:acetylxylan esterase [Chloroflexota bacterium]
MPQTTPTPSEFAAFWDALDAELAGLPAVADLEPLPLRSGPDYTCYTLRLTSVGPYRIFGYYSVPTGPGPHPGLLLTPRYGSVNHVPDYAERKRYAVLQIMHRGQRLADRPYAAAYPGLLTDGIDTPEGYVYRGIVADCLRAAEFLASRDEVDRSRIGIAGDDLAIITAARRPVFSVLQVTGYLLYRAAEARLRSEAYPTEELNDYTRAFPDQEAAIDQTVGYYGAELFAPAVTIPSQLAVGDDGAINGPEWLAPLAEALGGPVDLYRLTHAGGADNDALDTWLAGQLGVPPLPKFLRELA